MGKFHLFDQLRDQISLLFDYIISYLILISFVFLIIYALCLLCVVYPDLLAFVFVLASLPAFLLLDYVSSNCCRYGCGFVPYLYIFIPSAIFSILYWVGLYQIKKLPWIRRECRLLGAVCKDIRALQNGETDNQFLNYDDVRLELTEEEEQWKRATEDLVRRAEAHVNIIPFDATKHLLVRPRLSSVSILGSLDTHSLSRDISKQKKKPEFVSIIKKLEKSRPKFPGLRLEGKLIEDGSESACGEQVVCKVTSIRDAIQSTGNEVEVKLVLFEAFLKDLEHAKLESAMEKVWLEEVKVFLEDEYNALKECSLLKEHEAAEPDTGILSARRVVVLCVSFLLSVAFRHVILRVRSKEVADGLVELLVVKNIYSIKIIRRVQQANSFQNGVHSKDSGPDVEFIRGKLNSPISPAAANPLPEKLEGMQTELKAIEGVSNFGSVCLEQIRKTTSELKEAPEDNFQEWKTFNIDELETSSIKRQIQDMKRFIAAYDTKARPKWSTGIDLEEDADELIKKLTSEQDERCVFSIVGMQGIGKTTLANKVYLHRKITSHFSYPRIWVSMHQGSDEVKPIVEDVANQILRGNGSQELEKEKENEYYRQKIRSFLQGNRFLVVLDNVPSKTVWDELKDAFPESCCRSRILLTSRDRMWDSEDDTSNEHINLRLRTKEESWALFLDIAQFPSELSSQKELERKAKEVVASCWGLPLSLLKLGILMAGEAINDHQLWKATQQVKKCETLWPQKSQINLLPDDLKELLPYFTLFPKNSEIPARRLTALWVAERLAKLWDDRQKTPENIAEDCLLRLVQRNIIQPLKMNVDGKVMTCCLPDPVRSVLLSPCPDPQQPGPLRCVLSTSSDRQRLAVAYHSNYYIVDNFEFNDGADIDSHPPNVQPNADKKFVTLISFDIREGDKPGSDIGNFLHKGITNGSFKRIKVLDLERVFRPRLTETIGKLIELTYLGLRWTYLEEIPSTIGKLSNLQTLDLKHTYIRILPSTIGKLQKLRHLYLNQTCRGKFVQQSKTKSLLNLQTLWGVFLDENSPLKDLLHELKSLRKLELSLHLSREEQEKLADRIAKLTNLRSLRLRSVSVMSEAQDLRLGNFSGLWSLSSLYLFGRLENASRFLDFPTSLSDLTLSASGLEDDPLPILEKLPKLRSLCLFAGSFTGRRMVCSERGFPELLVLKIWKLDILKDWTIKEQAMQKLKELEIRSCPELEFPDGLNYLQTLRKVKVGDMQKDFIDRLVDYAKIEDPPSIINL